MLRCSSACTRVAGTPDGVMNHTVSGRDYQNLWFNGTLVGETGINAALCGTWGCPVAPRHRRRPPRAARGRELLGPGLDDRGGEAGPR